MFFGASLFLATLVGSLLVVSVLLVKLPVTYFQDFHSRDFRVGCHPALRLTARIGKNVLGVILVVVGIVLMLPGVPGKRRLERRIVGRRRILHAINRLRKRFGRPPLVLGGRRGAPRRKALSDSVSLPPRRG
ncbi:MAG: hypothetical protein DME15_11115 [Candidatus Rokuibacteriota bacterium]|nr:MAG: hypothetical protein DME15_11115 [Candidatus Rokubacteria bacterium]